MNLSFTPTGWSDYAHWQRADRAVLKRLNTLLDAVVRDPYSGIGKPEQLRHEASGMWSRRITDEHRLVYVVRGDDVVVIQARFHY